MSMIMQSLHELKDSFKRLYRDYGYSVTVILTMASTLAISLFLFTMVYTIQYKPLPKVNAPDNIIWGTLESNGSTYSLGGLSNYNFEYIKQHQTTLEYFGRVEQRMLTLSNAQLTEQVRGAAVSHELFQLLGISTLKGRVLLSSDEVLGTTKNIVISYRLWNTLFNKSELIFEETIKLDGEAVNIVGVMPDGFNFPTNHDVWFVDTSGAVVTDPHGGWNSIFGRLKPNTTIDEVQDEFNRLEAEIQREYTNQYKGKGVALAPFTLRFASSMEFLLSILKIATIAIFLMGCFSVSNLIIVRNLENAKEILIKSALGVPVFRIALSVLLETFWLCVMATIIGLWLCFMAITYFGENVLEGPYWWKLQFEFRVFLCGILAALVIWVATGLVPAWMATRRPTNGMLSSGRKGGGGGGSALNYLMSGLSALQIFSVFILMVFTGVLIGGLIRIINADYGVPREGYLTVEVKLSGERYTTLEQRNEYYQRFIEQAPQIADIDAAAVSGALPGASGYLSTFSSVEKNIEVSGAFPKSLEIPISDTYFSVMKISLLEGRNFNASDKAGAEEVAIINESMANLLFSGESAVGRQFQYDPENNGGLLTIVGVVPDVVSGNPLWYLSSRSKNWRSQLYRPITQKQPEWDSNNLIFLTDGNPYSLTTAIKSIAADIDSEIPIYNIKSYDDFLADNETGFRRLILIFTPAAVLALIISASGVFSTTRRVVLQNTPNIGIMRAIGIEERLINRKYMRKSIVQLFLSLFAGIIFSFFILPKLPQNILITDIETICMVSFVVAIVISALVLFASYLPLFNAHKMSPRSAMNFMSASNN